MRRSLCRYCTFVLFSMYLAKNSIIVSLFEALSQVTCPIYCIFVSLPMVTIAMHLPCEQSQDSQQFWTEHLQVVCCCVRYWVLQTRKGHCEAPIFLCEALQSNVPWQQNIHLCSMPARHHMWGLLHLGQPYSINKILWFKFQCKIGKNLCWGVPWDGSVSS